MNEVLDLLHEKLEAQKAAKKNFWKDLFPGCSDKYIKEKMGLIDKRITQLENAIKILSDFEPLPLPSSKDSGESIPVR